MVANQEVCSNADTQKHSTVGFVTANSSNSNNSNASMCNNTDNRINSKGRWVKARQVLHR